MKRMAESDTEDPTLVEETETRRLKSPLPDAAAKGKIWSDTKEVYFLK